MKLKKLIITLALALCIITTCAVFASASTKFTDVNGDEWYADAVLKANELGIMNGTSESTFAPLKNLSRAEYVAILFRLSGGEENMEFSFTDVPDDAWYKKYVGWAESAGVITGYGNAETFGGNELITREQLMLMTSRYMKYEWVSFEDSATAVQFNDAAKISSWAADGVEVTRKAGLITGDAQSNFNPQNNATRAEIATIVVRYAEKLPEARDPMHMKHQYINELVETDEGKYPVIKLGSFFPYRQHRPDVFGEILLPQMGLDLETYEFTMDEDAFLKIKKDYQNAIMNGDLPAGECKPKVIIKYRIHNKVTDEYTQEKVSLFNIYYESQTIDSLTYDLHLPEEMIKEMNEASLYSLGNYARLAKAFEKAKAGEPVNVSYIGGSLTEGASSTGTGSWPSATNEWLEANFPNAIEFRINNAGIGGTNSVYGVVRLQKDVLQYDPDILFVEFAVNDGVVDDDKRQSFEAIIRTALEYEENTAVVMVLTALYGDDADANFEATRNIHKDIAAYYGLPVIDFHAGLQAGLKWNLFTPDDITKDGLHVTAYGHQIEGKMVHHALENLVKAIDSASAAELKVQPVPAKMFGPGDKYMELHSILPSNKDELDTLGSWEIALDKDSFVDGFGDPKWDAFINTGDAALEFTFTGTALYFQCPRYDVFELKVNIDGKDYIGRSYADRHFSIEGLENKSHKVKITVHSKDEGVTPSIYGITYR